MDLATEVVHGRVGELARDQFNDIDLSGAQRAAHQHQEFPSPPHLAGGGASRDHAEEAQRLAERQAMGGPGDLGQLPRVPQNVRDVVSEGRDDERYSGTATAFHPDNNDGCVVQELPESLRAAVEVLDQKLCGLVIDAKPQGPVQ